MFVFVGGVINNSYEKIEQGIVMVMVSLHMVTLYRTFRGKTEMDS
jgi:hypothetical protein